MTKFIGSTQGYSGNDDGLCIYTVTSIDEEHYSPIGSGRDNRCWGWYPTLKEAKTAVKNNAGDMAECCSYTHIVIEKTACGIPSLGMAGDSDETENWYKWKMDPSDPYHFRGQWHTCKKPKWSEGIVGMGLG